MEQLQTDLTVRGGKGLSGAVLKWTAIITMFIDHFGAALFIIYTPRVNNRVGDIAWADQAYWIMRGIGRTAFPIFCFLLVEGFLHTKHIKRYIARMFLFSIISEIPFDLAINGKWFQIKSQNVYWTLLLGLLAMVLLDQVNKRVGRKETAADTAPNVPDAGNDIKLRSLKVLFRIAITASFMAIAYFLKTDYSFKGVALILILYFLHHDRLLQLVTGYIAMIWEGWCFPGFILMYFYNGKRGRQPKYFFYLFYPCHLILLYLLRIYLWKR